MWSKLPLLHSCPGGVRKSTFHGPWQSRGQLTAPPPRQQARKNPPTPRLGQGKSMKRTSGRTRQSTSPPLLSKGLFKNYFRFCWRLFGLVARREGGSVFAAILDRSSNNASMPKSPSPQGRGGTGPSASLLVSRRSTQGISSFLAPRRWPGGAPAKIGINF